MKRTTPARKKVAIARKERTKERIAKENELGDRRDQSHTPHDGNEKGGIESVLSGRISS